MNMGLSSSKMSSKGPGTFVAMAKSLVSDVVMSNDSCEVLPDGLDRIRKEAEESMLEGMENFGHLPIDLEKLRTDTLDKIFNERNICKALKGITGATARNHNKLRAKYKEDGLNAKGAEKMGIIFQEIPLKMGCPVGDEYDWKNSPVYYGVEKCEDVIDEIEEKGMPTVLYVTKLGAPVASEESNNSINERHYKKYANGGPILCGSQDEYKKTYHHLNPSKFYNPKFVLKGVHGMERLWSSSTILKECRSSDGAVYKTENIMFIFSFRTFVQMNVDIDGEQKVRTLVLNQVASASTNPFSPLLPKSWVYDALLGGEAARRLLFEALANGWEITGP